MTDNKNLKYALIGGAAVLGAAVLYYVTAGAEGSEAKSSDSATVNANENEEKMDDDLE